MPSHLAATHLLRCALIPSLILLPLIESPRAVAQSIPVTMPLDVQQAAGRPQGFTMDRTGNGAPAEWRLVEDATAPGGRALLQVSTDRTDYRFPLAIHDGIIAANVAVTVRFNSVAGEVDRAAGIAVRLADADNYYVVRANALEDNVNFYRVMRGSRRLIKARIAKVTAGEWHTLGLHAQGDRFTISFDGTELFTVTDRTFTRAGKIALWTKADSVTRFAALRIETLP